MYSADKAWSAKLISITDGGWPSAEARLIRRPSPKRLILRPSFNEYSSTKLLVVRFEEDIFSSAGMSISTLKWPELEIDRKSTRLNSSHSQISYAVFCLKKKKNKNNLILTYVNQ